MKWILLLATHFCVFTAVCQKEGNNWYFGTGTGITFNTNPPSFIPGSSMNTYEGCSSVSNENGDLLFYTDGQTVFTKNNLVMMNGTGLFGHFSSTNSAVILQNPGSNKNLYYVFTLSERGDSKGLNYSIVDMSEESGLGKVTQKNINLINAPLCEKLATSRNCDGSGFWLVVHGFNNDLFYALEFTDGKFGAPISSKTGSLHPSYNGSGGVNATASGSMRISNNGKKLALAIGWSNKVELFDFNSKTGVVSSPVYLHTHDKPYGIEFSPNSNYLYVSDLTPNNYISQYEIISRIETVIQNSKTIVGKTAGAMPGGIQMGPDNKLYICINTKSYLGVIEYPDLKGINCKFIENYVSLKTGVCQFGLPNIFPGYINTTNIKLAVKDTCFGDSTIFSVSNFSGTCFWKIKDLKNNSIFETTGTTFKYKFMKPGPYLIYAVDSFNCLNSRKAYPLFIANKSAQPLVLRDTFICLPNSLNLNLNTLRKPYFSYKWSNNLNDTGLNKLFLTGGKYELTEYSTCSQMKGEINIKNEYVLPSLNLGKDLNFCASPLIAKISGNINGNYLWSTGENTKEITIYKTGNYSATVSNICSSTSDEITITQNKSNVPLLTKDTNVCISQAVEILIPNNYKQVSWSTGQTGNYLKIINPGTYTVKALDEFDCVHTDAINISSNGRENQPLFIPNSFTPNGDLLNDTFMGKTVIGIEKLEVFNRWGEKVWYESNTILGWLPPKTIPEGNYIYKITYRQCDGRKKHYSGVVEIMR